MGDEPTNLVLLVDESEPSLGQIATTLTRAQIPLIHATGCHEAASLARRRRAHVRCVLYRPRVDPQLIRTLARAPGVTV